MIEVNELQKRRVIGKLAELLGSLRGKRIALLGLAFKPNTDDTREAPAFVLAGRLLAEGADVVAWDPIASSDGLHGVEQVPTVEEAARDADAVVLVTEWPQLETSTGPRSPRRCGSPSSSTAGTCSTRARCVPPGSRTTRSGARLRPADGGDRPRRREGRAARRRDRWAAEVARHRRRAPAPRLADRPARAGRRGARDRQLPRRAGGAPSSRGSATRASRSCAPASRSGSAAAAASASRPASARSRATSSR